MKRAIGIDVGGTTIKGATITDNGQLIYKTEWNTESEKSSDFILERISDFAKHIANESQWDWGTISGIGIGLPGMLDYETGYVVEAENLHWKQVEVIKRLQNKLNVTVKFENDANAAALGEAWLGGAKGKNHIVLVTIGTGVGGGIIINGSVYQGDTGSAGEIGHMIMDPLHGERCNCGKFGCLETISSATAILRKARDHFPDIKTTKDVFEMAIQGCEEVHVVIEHAMQTLGLALANIGNTLNPQAFVIGGGISKSWDFILPMIQTTFEKFALDPVKKNCAIVPASLGNDAGVFGAAKLIL